LATIEKDPKKKHEMRTEIAQKIKEYYKENMKAEDVTDCDGCRAKEGRLFSGSKNCEIRKCAQSKEVENCAHCSEYACEKLNKLFNTDLQAKEKLDEIRRKL